MSDPPLNKESEIKGDVKEPEIKGDVKEPEIKGDVKEPEKEGFIALQTVTGELVHVKPDEAYVLMQTGYQKMVDDKKGLTSVSQNVEDEPTTEEKLAAVEVDLKSLRAERQNEQQLAGINQTLYQQVQKHEETKDDPDFAKSVMIETLAHFQYNSRQPLELHFAEVLKNRLEQHDKFNKRTKDKASATDKVNAMLVAPTNGGGLPGLEPDKKWTAEDMKTGASRKALAEVMRSLTG